MEILPSLEYPKLSIDRVSVLIHTGEGFSFVYDMDGKGSRAGRLYASLRSRFFSLIEKEFEFVPGSSLYYKHVRLLGGVDLQMFPVYPVKVKVTDEGYLQAFGDAYQQEQFKKQGYALECYDSEFGIRLEFNPNKCNLWQCADVLSFLYELVKEKNSGFDSAFRFTRLDVCIDYPIRLVPSLFSCNGKRKSALFSSSSDGIETVYFGTRSSSEHFRIYNKKNELRQVQDIEYQGENLWRVELEWKKPFSFLESYEDIVLAFRDLTVFGSGVNSSALQTLLEFYALHNGTMQTLALFPRTTRYRYKKELETIPDFVLPYDIAGKQFYPVWRDFCNDFRKAFSCDESVKRYSSPWEAFNVVSV